MRSPPVKDLSPLRFFSWRWAKKWGTLEKYESLLRQSTWLYGVFSNLALPSKSTQCIRQSSRKSSSKCGPKVRSGEQVGSGRDMKTSSLKQGADGIPWLCSPKPFPARPCTPVLGQNPHGSRKIGEFCTPLNIYLFLGPGSLEDL